MDPSSHNTTDNSNDRNYPQANKDYMNFINMNYLTSGIFLNKNLHDGLFEKRKNNENNEKNEK